jgi:hypothetical protein
MINLIPTAAKKRVVIEYWVRTISAWAFLGGTALLLMASLFIPLNLYVINQETYLATLLANNESAKDDHEEHNAVLLRANGQAVFLLQDKREYTAYELLPRILEVARGKVALEEMSLSQVKDPVLSIGGTATTRQSLVDFRDELEKQIDFLTVDLPINNLIEESDVTFSIRITLATSTPAI